MDNIVENTDLRTWEGGDETMPPSRMQIINRSVNPNVLTPETEAEEI